MPEGLTPSLADALDAAAAELGLAEPSATEADLPSVEDDAASLYEPVSQESEGIEQPEAGNEVDSLLNILAETAQEASTDAPQDFWSQVIEIEIDGQPQRMSLDEMRRGTMMRADYTRKTQELARERGLVSEAVDFHAAFKEDPQGFAAYLAERAGLVEPGRAPNVDGVKLFTSDDIESLVQERLNQELEKHPDVVAARQAKAISTVEGAFSAIEEDYGMTISKEHKALVLREAQKAGSQDLRLVFDALLLRGAQLAQARKQLAATAPVKSGGTPTFEADQSPAPRSIEEALRLAEKELSATVG